MRKAIFGIISLLFLNSCVSSDRNEVNVPSDIQQQVEDFIDQKELEFDHQFETYEGIQWDQEFITTSDSIVYFFEVIYEREGKEYPFEHRVIVCSDTISDIQKFSLLNNRWTSLFTKPFDVKKQDFWKEISDSENIQSISANDKKLELVDSVDNIWREVFTQNVVLTFNSGDTLWTDTLVWCPQKDSISTSSMKIATHKSEMKTILSGSGLNSNADFTEYAIHGVKEAEYKTQ